MTTHKDLPRLYRFRHHLTDKANFGFDADGARIGDTPNITIDCQRVEYARLFEAAPDLLEALKNITECAEAGADGANMDLWIEQAHAAIKLATEGRS